MSRLQSLFQQKQHHVLNVYCTAGYPSLDSTVEVMEQIQKNGGDIIELGMPYSDPLADGPVIQHSSSIALENGMTIQKLFAQLHNFRSLIHIPVILMGYMNPVLQYGFEKFCQDAADAGIDGLILPDLPEFEFENEFAAIILQHKLDFIFLVTPETSEARIRRLDKLSSGFLYAVSSSSTTGNNAKLVDTSAYLQRLQSMQLKNPVLVGFGIKDKISFEKASYYTNGAIIGSAFIEAIGKGESLENSVKAFLEPILS